MAATYEKITSTTLASNAANIFVSNIPQSFDAIAFNLSVRSDHNTARTTIIFLPNNISSNIARSEIYLENDSFGTEVNLTNGICGNMNGSQGNSDLFTNCIGIFPNYKTSQNKVMYGRFGQPTNTSISYSLWNTFISWKNSDPITSLYVIPGSGQIVSGSEIIVYGIKYQ